MIIETTKEMIESSYVHLVFARRVLQIADEVIVKIKKTTLVLARWYQ